MLADELEQRLFVIMLERASLGECPRFELEALCHDHKIVATREKLRDFANYNHGIYGSKEPSEMHVTRFELNSQGVRKAKEIKSQLLEKSIIGKIKAIPRSDWIAFGALVMSLVALFK